MPDRADIEWFKQQFQARIEPALQGTPIGVDLIVAIACQETGHIWPVLRNKGFGVPQILALCVGDTLDADRGRSAFPRTKSELMAATDGPAMFAIARQGLVDMAQHINGFAGAAARPNKFCHGFGLFQRDLQFFLNDPQYFLQKRYEQFEDTLAQCVGELNRAVKKLGLQDRPSLSDIEMAAVGIAYNTGGFKPAKGLKQGHFDGTRFYGELVFDFIRLSRTVALPGDAPPLAEPPPGQAIVPPPTPVTAGGAMFKVSTQVSALNVRSEPKVSTPPNANVKGTLPDGHPVRAVTDKAVSGFREIETSLNGGLLQGFCSAKFLVPETALQDIPVVQPEATPPASGVVAVFMPRKAGRVTKRSEEAGAHSLNEANQPGRVGTTPDALRAELARIIDWLAVDKPTHKRYQPRAGLTFCNIYAHDFCHLAGAYLPRVWWTQKAVVALTRGEAVEPLIGATISEVRANDLFRWLSEFGPTFGWRQTGTLTKLQQAANQGALGLIVARRREDGRSGHIVMVVPETNDATARRDAAGEVTAPLQSQAGASNFRLGTGRAGWWRGEEFAESAFWLHA
jgi:hypothetical protein